MPRTKAFDEQEVLEKAMELFWKNGYHATSIQDLVDHLGINRASLYDTFGGKKELFDRAFHRYLTDNTTQLNQLFATQTDVKAGFRQLFYTALKESARDRDLKGCFVVNTTTELIPGEEKILKVLQENRQRFSDIFFAYLRKGEETGQIPAGKNLKAISSLFFSFYNGMKVVAKTQPEEEEMLAAVETMLQLLD